MVLKPEDIQRDHDICLALEDRAEKKGQQARLAELKNLHTILENLLEMPAEGPEDEAADEKTYRETRERLYELIKNPESAGKSGRILEKAKKKEKPNPLSF